MNQLAEHARVSISFEVNRILRPEVSDGGLGGIKLREIVVAQPWMKGYDGIDGEPPTQWAERFDLSRWGLIAAYRRGERVGGAVIAWNPVGSASRGWGPSGRCRHSALRRS